MNDPAGDDAFRERTSRELPSRYVLGPRIGTGGMGVVFQAEDRLLGRSVALKVIPEESESQGSRRHRFLREARTVASLLHPNIVPLYDAGNAENHLWYSMGLIAGLDLRKWVESQGPMSMEQAVEMVQEVGQALAYAHARGVIHRDVKPENVIIERSSGRAYLCDFGIAKVEDPALTMLTTNVVLGSPLYAAPEHLLEESRADSRSDQYSLALVLCFVLTGSDAVAGDSLPGVVIRYVEGWSPAQEPMPAQWPDAFKLALKKALARHPHDRFDSIESWILAIRAAVPASDRPAAGVGRRLHELDFFATAVSVLLLGLGGAWFFGRSAPVASLLPFVAGAGIGIGVLLVRWRWFRPGKS